MTSWQWYDLGCACISDSQVPNNRLGYPYRNLDSGILNVIMGEREWEKKKENSIKTKHELCSMNLTCCCYSTSLKQFSARFCHLDKNWHDISSKMMKYQPMLKNKFSRETLGTDKGNHVLKISGRVCPIFKWFDFSQNIGYLKKCDIFSARYNQW